MNEEEKNAIEYLKNRLYGNEDCKYIDVAQEDLRVFIKLIEKLQKENEELKKSKITYEKVRDIQEKNKNIVDNEYIPKQKVKDKIEELNKKEIDAERFNERLTYRYQKQVLQELIEERGEK